jgi:hypothetical protein
LGNVFDSIIFVKIGPDGFVYREGDVDLDFLGFREMKSWEWITKEKIETVIRKMIQNSFHILDKAGASIVCVLIII